MPGFLSIGIPARNEQDSIEKCIKWITRSIAWKQAPSTEKELIVCINGSTDKTAQVVRNLAKQIPEIKLIELKEAGKNQAINTIVAHSSKRADAIYFSDADVLVKRDTIGKVLKELRQNPKIEFAAPIVVPSSAFVPPKKRSPTAALYAEGSRLGRKYKLYRLPGPSFAVKKPFLANHPLPLHDVGDDRFINLAYPGKIKVVYDAVIVSRQVSLRDHLRQRVRHKIQKRTLLERYPNLRERAAAETKGISPRKMQLFKQVSGKAKAGFFLNQLAEAIAAIKAKRRQKELWPQIKSTKLGKRR